MGIREFKNPEYRSRNIGVRIQESGYRSQDTGVGIEESGYFDSTKNIGECLENERVRASG